jgi:hypothetical protein
MSNREEHHTAIAANLRSTQDAKCAKTAANAAAKKAQPSGGEGMPAPAAKRRRTNNAESNERGDVEMSVVSSYTT